MYYNIIYYVIYYALLLLARVSGWPWQWRDLLVSPHAVRLWKWQQLLVIAIAMMIAIIDDSNSYNSSCYQ